MANYSVDKDLEVYEQTVLTHLPQDPTRFTAQHAEAKRVIDEIILLHLDGHTLSHAIDEADLKTVSVFYTLFMIFNWISARRGDNYWHKARTYRALFEDAMSTLSLDVVTCEEQDNGEEA